MRSSASATLMSASNSGKSFRAYSTTGESKSGIPPGSSIHHFYSMNDAFAAQNLRRFAEIIADVRLRPDPIDVAPDALGKIDTRLVTGGANTRCVAGQMAHLARTKFAVYLRRDVDFERI